MQGNFTTIHVRTVCQGFCLFGFYYIVIDQLAENAKVFPKLERKGLFALWNTRCHCLFHAFTDISCSLDTASFIHMTTQGKVVHFLILPLPKELICHPLGTCYHDTRHEKSTRMWQLPTSSTRQCPLLLIPQHDRLHKSWPAADITVITVPDRSAMCNIIADLS